MRKQVDVFSMKFLNWDAHLQRMKSIKGWLIVKEVPQQIIADLLSGIYVEPLTVGAALGFYFEIL